MMSFRNRVRCIALACAGVLLLYGGARTAALQAEDRITESMPVVPKQAAATVFNFGFEPNEDLDFDGQPDDWSRRIGPGFPHYVDIEIERDSAHAGRQSLRIDADGGGAILYSPPQPVDARHTYLFRGWIRTEQLQASAARISVSFLDHRRQRVQRWLTTAVTGTHAEWVEVELGPLQPHADTRFVVIGCHLVSGEKLDIVGGAWFDDLTLGRLPRMVVESHFGTHFLPPSAPVRVKTRVGGLDGTPPLLLPLPIPGISLPQWSLQMTSPEYELKLSLIDSRGRTLGRKSFPLNVEYGDFTTADQNSERDQERIWEVAARDYGFYLVHATLLRNDQPIQHERMSFVVLDKASSNPKGEFGWSLSQPVDGNRYRELSSVALEAGINWIKLPLWSTGDMNTLERGAQSEFFAQLQVDRIVPVGVLSDPPADLRRRLGTQGAVSEVFRQKTEKWWPDLEPILAQYSSTVRYWQLGGDLDTSFMGLESLGETLASVKTEFDRIGRDVHLGVAGDMARPPAAINIMPKSFLALHDPDRGAKPVHQEQIKAAASVKIPRWVTVRALGASTADTEIRGADLVRQMVAAKIAGAEAIFAADAIGAEYGLVNADGSPTSLFLPWRTVSQSLRGAEYLGSFVMPSGSENHVFARTEPQPEVVLIVWNDTPVVEDIYLGEPQNVSATNVWGEQSSIPVDARTQRQQLQTGPLPQVIRGCAEPVARWRLATRYERGRQPSTTGEHAESILGTNTFPQGVSGRISVLTPNEWEVEPSELTVQAGPGEAFAVPMRISLPANVTLGSRWTALEFDIAADRRYRFRVYRPYRVGLGDVELAIRDTRLPNGVLEVELSLTNNTQPLETLDFECSLFVPGLKRQKMRVTRLGAGRSKTLFYVPNADRLRGQELWIRAEEVEGRRILNYRWNVGRDWETPVESP